MLYIVAGGSGSGKSEYAEQTAVQCRNRTGGTLWYLATMRIWDDEGRNGWNDTGGCARQKDLRRLRGIQGLETLELRDIRRIKSGWFGC